jgi:hypothetical protein
MTEHSKAEQPPGFYFQAVISTCPIMTADWMLADCMEANSRCLWSAMPWYALHQTLSWWLIWKVLCCAGPTRSCVIGDGLQHVMSCMRTTNRHQTQQQVPFKNRCKARH